MLTQSHDEWGDLYLLTQCERGNGVVTSVVIYRSHDGYTVGSTDWGDFGGGAALGLRRDATASI